MRLPRFLHFLAPKFKREQYAVDGLGIRGHILVERQVNGGPKEVVHESPNFIVDVGLTAVRDLLIGPNGAGFTGSIFRMAVGDGGVPPGDLFNPILPDATWPARTALFHEVIRQDISVFSEPTDFSARFVGSFSSLDVDDSSYSLTPRVINEAALIIGDGIVTFGGDKKQVNQTVPDVVDADEVMLSTRTFNSQSFDPLDDVTVSITWTITVSN